MRKLILGRSNLGEATATARDALLSELTFVASAGLRHYAVVSFQPFRIIMVEPGRHESLPPLLAKLRNELIPRFFAVGSGREPFGRMAVRM